MSAAARVSESVVAAVNVNESVSAAVRDSESVPAAVSVRESVLTAASCCDGSYATGAAAPATAAPATAVVETVSAGAVAAAVAAPATPVTVIVTVQATPAAVAAPATEVTEHVSDGAVAAAVAAHGTTVAVMFAAGAVAAAVAAADTAPTVPVSVPRRRRSKLIYGAILIARMWEALSPAPFDAAAANSVADAPVHAALIFHVVVVVSVTIPVTEHCAIRGLAPNVGDEEDASTVVPSHSFAVNWLFAPSGPLHDTVPEMNHVPAVRDTDGPS